MFSTFTNRMRGTLLLLMAVFSLQTFAQSLPSKIEDGVILHWFNWKYSDIKAELSKIKAAGFVAVQTSPAQLNVTNQDNWNILYRPRDSKAGPNVLGTSSDLKALAMRPMRWASRSSLTLLPTTPTARSTGLPTTGRTPTSTTTMAVLMMAAATK